MPKTHDLRVTITDVVGGNYAATIDVESQPSRPAHKINWFFDAPENFPENSVLYVRFFRYDNGVKIDDGGCMHGTAWSGGVGEAVPNGRSIAGKVKNSAQGTFKYEIRYREELGDDHQLMDPEIVVDGGPDPIKGEQGAAGGTRRPAQRRQATKKTAAKKAKKVKKAGKSKKSAKAKKSKRVARKAKRSTKRKAKKR